MTINHLQHEQASVDMFHHMLDKNPQVRDEFEKWNLSTEEHGKFVAELIMGEPDKNSSQVSIILHSHCLLANHSVHLIIYIFLDVCLYV